MQNRDALNMTQSSNMGAGNADSLKFSFKGKLTSLEVETIITQ
jgi:hypothetical protein